MNLGIEGALRNAPSSGRMHPAPPAPVVAAESAGLMVKVNRARTEIDRDQIRPAEERLRDVLAEVTALQRRPTSPRKQSQLASVEGAAASLLGQLLTERDAGDAARQLLSRAAGLFEVMSDGPGTGQAWCDYGLALKLLGRREQAIQALEKAVALGDPSGEPHRRLAGLLLESGDAERAESVLWRARSAGHRDLKTLRLLAEVLRVLDRDQDAGRMFVEAGNSALASGHPLEEALELFDAGAELLPDDADAHYYVGELLRRMNRLDESRQSLDRALQSNPSHAESLASKGDVLRIQGDQRGALEALDAALRIQPAMPSALATKGDVLRILDRLDEAETTLRESIELDPDSAWAIGTLGQVLRGQGRLRVARDELTRALDLNPDLAWARADLAATQFQLGEFVDAAESSRHALKGDSDHPLALAVGGLTALRLDDLDQAAEHFTRLSRIEPNSEWVWFELARTHFDLEHYDDALGAIERVLASSPGHLDAQRLRGISLISAGRYREGIKQLEHYLDAAAAAAADDDDVDVREQIADAYAAIGDHTGALQFIDTALSALTTQEEQRGYRARLLAHRARTLVELGAVPDARVTLGQLLQQGPFDDSVLEQLLALPLVGSDGVEATVSILADSIETHSARPELYREKARLEFQLDKYHDVISSLSGIEEPEMTAEDYWLRGEAQRLLLDRGNANRSFKKALERDVRHLAAMTGLIYLHLDEGQPHRARRWLERAWPGNERNLDLRADRGLVELAEDNFVGAMRSVESVLTDDPRHAWALTVKARILLAQGAFAAAQSVLRAAYHNGADSSRCLSDLGWALENDAMLRATDQRSVVGEVSMTAEIESLVGEALRSYEQALDLYAGDPWIGRGVADANSLLGNGDIAGEWYRRVIDQIFEQSSYDVNAIALLGWCYHRLGKNEKAVKTFITVVSGADGSKDMAYVHFDLALAMLAAGHPDQALLEYERGVTALSAAVPLRRRGQVLVARNDLAAALIDGRVEAAEAAAAAFEVLDTVLAALDGARE